MKRIINIIIVIVFTFTITLPLVFSDKVGGKQAYWENRMLAMFPKIFADKGKLNSNILPDFEAWASDNIALRTEAIKANMFIRYGIFGISPQTDVYTGKDNWMFYTSKNGIENYQRINSPDDAKLKSYAQKCQSMKNALASNGIPSFFMVYPSKETVYSEYFPKSVLHVNNDISNTEKICNYIKNNTSVDITYIKDTMLAQKNSHVLYSKAVDYAHWNNYGAYIGYLELIKKASIYIPHLKILSPDDMDIKEIILEPKIYGIKKTNETDYNVKPKSGYHSESAKDTLSTFKTNDFWKSRNRYVNQDTTLPKVLIVGDSFTWMYMLPNISESFSDLIFIHFLDVGFIEDYVNYLQPDIVIFAVRDTDISWLESFGSYHFNKETIINTDKSTNKDVNNDAILSLPEKKTVQEMYNGMIVDTINGRNLKEQGKIKVLESDTEITLYGWAADFNAKLPASGLYVKIGNTIYKTDYGISRTSVSDYYKDPALKNTGFQITLSKDVVTEKELSFIIVANDRTYRFKAIPYVFQTGDN